MPDLRDLPDPRFKARLRGELFPKEETTMEAVATVTSVRPYFIVKGADDLVNESGDSFSCDRGNCEDRHPSFGKLGLNFGQSFSRHW